MVANKHISKFIIALMAVAVALCFLAMGYADKLTKLLGGTGVTMEYETALFDTDEPITVDIQMDEDEWNQMLANAMSEEYCVCDVVVNGQKMSNVAIRPKGNTSLSAIAMDPDSNRYSLKLEFDQYVDGQTCYGLDKLILNNNYADATNMKEAVIYDMYQYLGVDASLYNYAKVYVNGEYWGIYLALESVEESFMLRNYGTQDGELYKPESLGMGGGDENGGGGAAMPDMGNFDFSNMTPPSNAGDVSADGTTSSGGNAGGSGMPDMGNFDTSNMPDMSNFDTSNMPDMGSFDMSNMGGGASSSGGGSDLNYTDDKLDSYSTIWEGAVTGTSDSDHRKVVTALKNISEGTDLETYLDVDNVLKYMAVHTFAVNMDSLSGSMAHNYYLYEYDGQLNILPWDYNLSFGGMNMGMSSDGTSMINDAIDTPFSGTKFFDALLENEEYLAKYHEYLQQLVDEYVNGGKFDEFYNRTRNQIDSLVETDPTAFYSNEEYQTAVEMLYKTVQLRAESIDGQIKGTIPSTDAGQKADSSNLVDGSAIDIEAMGTFSMGAFGGGNDFSSFMGGGNSVGSKNQNTGAAEDGTSENSDAAGNSDAATQPPGDFDGSNMPEGFDGSNMPEGFEGSNMPGGSGGSGMPSGGFDASNMPEGFDASNMPEGFDASNMPEGFGGSNMSSGGTAAQSADTQSNAESSNAGAGENNVSAPSGMDMSSFANMAGGQSMGQSKIQTLIFYGICLAILLAVMICIKFFVRRR